MNINIEECELLSYDEYISLNKPVLVGETGAIDSNGQYYKVWSHDGKYYRTLEDMIYVDLHCGWCNTVLPRGKFGTLPMKRGQDIPDCVECTNCEEEQWITHHIPHARNEVKLINPLPQGTHRPIERGAHLIPTLAELLEKLNEKRESNQKCDEEDLIF